MIDRIKALLGAGGQDSTSSDGGHSFEEMQVAAAALLVEAAEMDASFDEQERAKVLELVRARFGLSEIESESLLALAQRQVAESSQLYGFTRTIKDHFVDAERIEMLEMLWEVAYVDGVLDDHEASLIRRIAGLIYVSDRDSGNARKRALEKLGLQP
jgi:uncharacterized tellurite resistance protein B-like protein